MLKYIRIVIQNEGCCMRKNLGFTLAEVLITLGIIGVVAAMTMPTIITNVSNNIFATRIKQVYSLLSSAVISYMAANDLTEFSPSKVMDYSNDSGDISINNLFLQSFSDVKTCYNPSPRCFAEIYTINNLPITSYNDRRFWREGSSFLLRNGSAVSMVSVGGQDRFRLVVDVNNKGFPNKMGRDLWVLYLNKNGTLSADPGNNQSCNSDYDACLEQLQNNDWKPDF